MRYLWTTLFLLAGVMGMAKELTIHAKVQNASTKEMGFSYVVNSIIEENKLLVVNLNEKDESYFIMPVADAAVVTVDFNNYFFNIYVKGADKIEFELDASTNQIQFKGENAAENNLWVNLNEVVRPDKSVKTIEKGYLAARLNQFWIEQSKTMTTETYHNLVLSHQKKAWKMLNEARSISTGFKNYMRNYITYTFGTAHLGHYISNKLLFERRYGEKNQMFNGYLNSIQINQDNLLNHPYYTNFLTAYAHYLHSAEPLKDPNNGSALYSIIRRKMVGEAKAWLLTKLMINAKKENNNRLAERNYPVFKEENPYPKYHKLLGKYYDFNLELNEEGAAPNFVALDESGQVRNLNEFRGKVVYISFWATWCKPCLMGFKKTQFVRQQLKDLGVVLLNVSVDESESTWRRTMVRVPMPGLNLRANPEDTQIKKDYELSKLPAYYIVDKNGNFTYLPDGSRDILTEFEKMVKE